MAIALIPARGGSEGIKNKNIINLKGKPLIEYSLIESIKSRLISRVFLSTNNKRIKQISKKYKSIFILNRKKKFCSSKALMSDVVCDAIKTIKKILKLKNFNIVLLQPTSPLRKAKDIDKAISEFYNNKKTKNLVSVSQPINHPNEILYLKKKLVKKLIISKDSNRQNFKNFFFVNGCIYICDANNFLKNKGFINENTQIFKMNKKFSLELDDYDDLKIMRGILDDLKN